MFHLYWRCKIYDKFLGGISAGGLLNIDDDDNGVLRTDNLPLFLASVPCILTPTNSHYTIIIRTNCSYIYRALSSEVGVSLVQSIPDRKTVKGAAARKRSRPVTHGNSRRLSQMVRKVPYPPFALIRACGVVNKDLLIGQDIRKHC